MLVILLLFPFVYLRLKDLFIYHSLLAFLFIACIPPSYVAFYLSYRREGKLCLIREYDFKGGGHACVFEYS